MHPASSPTLFSPYHVAKRAELVETKALPGQKGKGKTGTRSEKSCPERPSAPSCKLWPLCMQLSQGMSSLETLAPASCSTEHNQQHPTHPSAQSHSPLGGFIPLQQLLDCARESLRVNKPMGWAVYTRVRALTKPLQSEMTISWRLLLLL